MGMDTSFDTQHRKRLSLSYDRLIGYVLAKARENAGRSQCAVARLFGCKQSLVSKMELGQRSIKVSELPLLALALDIPEQELRSLLLAVLDLTEDKLLSLLAALEADDIAL